MPAVDIPATITEVSGNKTGDDKYNVRLIVVVNCDLETVHRLQASKMWSGVVLRVEGEK